jgi:cytoskeletal protein CcmA (bactofilin family)
MADITAKTVSVAGAYKGNIVAERVELLEGGRLWGLIKVQSFLLDEGAHFHGELVMQGGETQDPFGVGRPDAGVEIPVEPGSPAELPPEPPVE